MSEPETNPSRNGTARKAQDAPAAVQVPSPPAANIRYVYLSGLLKCKVRSPGQRAPIGRLYDVGMKNLAPYPRAACLQVRTPGRGFALIPWSSVISVDREGIWVRKEEATAPTPDFWLRRDVMDDQIIDISGAKVRRVNDIQMLLAEGHLLIVHVEVGMLGIIRRLGWERSTEALLRWLFDFNLKESFVSWKQVQLVPTGGASGPLRVSATPSRLAEIHPAELADILEQLGVKERQDLLNTLSVETAAETLEEADPDVQRSFLAQQEPGKAADILEEMGSNEAAEVLRDLGGSDAQDIIRHMETEAAEDVRTILSHKEESAGGIMSTVCIETAPADTAGSVLDYVRIVADDAEVLNQIYVLDPGRHLLGVLSLRELLRAAADTPVGTIMTTDVVKVHPEAGLEEVAKIFVKYGFRAVPVVDGKDTFIGSIRLINALVKLAPFIRE